MKYWWDSYAPSEIAIKTCTPFFDQWKYAKFSVCEQKYLSFLNDVIKNALTLFTHRYLNNDYADYDEYDGQCDTFTVDHYLPDHHDHHADHDQYCDNNDYNDYDTAYAWLRWSFLIL